jgi:hypothetical protein
MALKKHLTLLSAVRDTIHGSKVTPDEIADDLQISTNLVYRMALEGDSGDGFLKHLQRAVALIKTTRNYSIIETMAANLGGYFTKAPKSQGRSEQDVSLTHVNLNFANLLHALALLLDNPSREKKEIFETQLNTHLMHISFIKKQAEKNINQTNLVDILDGEGN